MRGGMPKNQTREKAIAIKEWAVPYGKCGGNALKNTGGIMPNKQ